MPGPLEGIKVFDLTRVLAGPTSTQILGDLGADVIKVERPGQGDDTRKWGPPFLRDRDGNESSEAAYYLAPNRNKRSVTIDIEKPEGQALARRMIAECDVLVENFKVGGLAKYGLGYEQLSVEFPRLVYCSITGFGQTGPYAPRPGYDYLVQGMGGLMSLTGEPDGMPMRTGVSIADLTAGLHATIGILAALRERDRNGRGQHVDIGLIDAVVSILANQGLNYLTTGENPPRLGNAHANIVPYQVFATRDGHLILASGNDLQFRRFCETANCLEIIEDPRFATNQDRVRNRGAATDALAAVMQRQTTAEWIAQLEAAGVPCAPIKDLKGVFEDPQVIARGLVVEMPHPLTDQPIKLIANPLHMSATPASYRHAPPTLGQHSDEVLGEFGLSADEIARLRAAGVV